MTLRGSIVLAVVLGVGIARADGGTGQAEKVRAAVGRSLPVLEREGVAWMEGKGCASCHVVPFMLWSHNEARARGVAVDGKKLAEWMDWTVAFSRSKRAWFVLTTESLGQTGSEGMPEAVLAKVKGLVDKPFETEAALRAELAKALSAEELNRHGAGLVKRAARPAEPGNDGGGLDTLSQLLLGRDRRDDSAKAKEFLAETRELMVRFQQADGSWKAAGQMPLQNRPHAETNQVSTMWAAVALGTLDRPDERTEMAIKRSVGFLGNVTPGESNESLIVAFLVARRFGPAEHAAGLLKELLSRQNADGGWAWRRGGASDAFATGQTLYALTRSAPTNDAAIGRARDYLLTSQAEDGSWAVPSRAISTAPTEGRAKRVAPIYRYWGTAWATIGLLETLPETTVAQALNRP